MLNNKCKRCGRRFHYCVSCDFDFVMLQGYCSDECYKKDMRYEDFLEWYTNLIGVSESPLEMKTLRDTKDELFESWCYIIKEG